jgi:DNA-binding protein HU-beta
MSVVARVPMANKEAIVSSLAAKASLTKADAEKSYEALLETITENLVAGRDVRLSGIGTLKVKMASARVSRNPKTGATCNVPARREVRFGASKELKSSVAAAT